MTKGNKEQGFTLVELAIVLVIIGLIVGGVLVGQDLIKAASIRATVTDIEKFNAAATTFRGKYSGYPGDLVSSKATQFGFLTATGRTGAAGMGDGNGLLEGCFASGSAGATNAGCETGLFWTDLGTAGLTPFHSTYDSSTAGVGGATETNGNLGASYMPKSKLRDSALFTVYSAAGRNYFGISAWSTSSAAGALTAAAGLSPLEARGIDEKLDDGMPTTGIVIAISAMTTTAATPDTTTACLNTALTPTVYNGTTDALLNAVACSIQVRTNF